jgi:hypothetical protein
MGEPNFHPNQAWKGGYDIFVTGANISIANGMMTFVIPNAVSTLGLVGSSAGFHWTMECSNDVFEGKVPEPSTMLLLGAGLTGLAFFRRRKY